MGAIVIFGATGTVGAYVSLYLHQLGYDVIAAGKRVDDNGFFHSKGIRYISVDVTCREAFKLLPVSNVSQVLHFAGAMPARMRNYYPEEYINTIIQGTLNVLEYARNTHACKIIFSQSISDILHLFGSCDPISPDVERRFPLQGDHSIYSISKNTAINLIQHYQAEYGIKGFILRLPTIYLYHPNPFYFVNGEKKWMGYRYLIERAKRGENIELWGDPNNKKEIVYVKDLVRLIECCVKSSLNGGIYNVGRGVGTTMKEQIDGIIDVFSSTHKKSSIIYLPNKPSSPQFILDISKTIEELGFIPQYTYMDYLRDFKKEMETEPFSKLWGVYSNYVK